MVKKYFLIAFLFTSIFGFSQNSTIKVDEKMFNQIKTGIEASDFIGAQMLLDKIESSGALNSHLSYLKGICNFNLPNLKNIAAVYFSKAVKNTSKTYKFTSQETNAPIISWYYLAKSYNSELLLDSAILCYNKYIELVGDKDKSVIDAKRCIEMCNNAKKYIPTNNSQPEKIANSKDNIFDSGIVRYVSPDIHSMIFTTVSKTDLQLFDNVDIMNIYISNYDEQSKKWLKPEKMIINESEVTAIVPEKQTVFIGRKSKRGDVDLYFTSYKNGKWTEMQKLESPINDPKSNETNACLSADGTTLYFISDRFGGFGGKDIYKSTRKEDGTWGTPQNLGAKVNTIYDEESPFILPDAVTLYFSSKGHDSMGGYDIFNTTQNEDGFWGEIENMGYPINTVEDDVFFFLTKDETKAFYSSAKKDGNGKTDIYQINLH